MKPVDLNSSICNDFHVAEVVKLMLPTVFSYYYCVVFSSYYASFLRCLSVSITHHFVTNKEIVPRYL